MASPKVKNMMVFNYSLCKTANYTILEVNT
jgi:hypothetical protein